MQTSLSSSGTLAALDSYSVTALVSGEVVAADFEEGDQVQEGDVLYRVDTDSVETQISSAYKQVERAQEDYEEALADYREAASHYGRRFTSKQELVQMIEHYICYYNTRRVQRNFGVLTPMEKHRLSLAA